ncbi:ENTH/VHS [Phaffia rhodozyma]|uniref:ENTH/VHS n=1 Tax=Phaffia rhodozyma TaxID=264483 RepID=A0A0F7STD5_PHARH|nr:ENTH/VHS [Phaffia rhodozyma]
MQLLGLLRRLEASQASIHRVVGFAIKYGSRCGEDLWECILEEAEKGSLNSRINVLYFLDSLCETSLLVGLPDGPYVDYITRDLLKVVDYVVPETREGALNLMSAKQILESWRTKRVVRPEIVDEALQTLELRKGRVHEISKSKPSSKKRGHFENFSQAETLRRMEEDRERHKRLRERIWILPIPRLSNPSTTIPRLATFLPPTTIITSSTTTSTTTNSTASSTVPIIGPNGAPLVGGLARSSNSSLPSSHEPSPLSNLSPFTPTSPSVFTPSSTGNGSGTTGAASSGGIGQRDPHAGTGLEVAIDLEFDQAWEGTSDLNEDDARELQKELELCYPGWTDPAINAPS